jgi:hypothetical protein
MSKTMGRETGDVPPCEDFIHMVHNSKEKHRKNNTLQLILKGFSENIWESVGGGTGGS